MSTTADWTATFPDPFERGRWWRAFGGNFTAATHWRTHFTDPAAAARWADSCLKDAATAAYLHARGHAPADAETAWTAALHEPHSVPGAPLTETTYRALLILAHPDLTLDDRHLIIRARITLDELPTIVTDNDLPNRDALHLLAGLR